MLIYTNGKPVRECDVVHIHRKPYTVARLSSQNGWVYVKTMDERASLKPVFPSDIGARHANAHVHPIMQEAFKCLR